MMIYSEDIIDFESRVRNIFNDSQNDVRAWIREEVRAALASAGQPDSVPLEHPSFPKPSGVRIDSKTKQVIQFMIEGQLIEVRRLISIFENCSAHAGFIYDHLRREEITIYDIEVQRQHRSRRHSAMRKAATMRDSCNQMARLLRGEDLDIDPDEEITGASRGQ